MLSSVFCNVFDGVDLTLAFLVFDYAQESAFYQTRCTGIRRCPVSAAFFRRTLLIPAVGLASVERTDHLPSSHNPRRAASGYFHLHPNSNCCSTHRPNRGTEVHRPADAFVDPDLFAFRNIYRDGDNLVAEFIGFVDGDALFEQQDRILFAPHRT